ncbi:hypothetical protein, partial [Enterococcus faecalis]|uniref:hypothetical protein n=1 Tax=Enterococcus faecalis TaxID=1351 RepID=UPI00403F37F4
AALAPIIGARIILTKGYSDAELNTMTATAKKIALASEAATVKMPYTVLGILLLVVAVLFALTHLPKIQGGEHEVSSSKNIFHAF